MPDGKWVSKANLQTFWQMIRSKVLPTMIGDTVTTWLTEHVDPVGSAVVVDDTLTIQGAAADAKKTGDEISGLKEDLREYNAVNLLPHLSDQAISSSGVTGSVTDDVIVVNGTTTGPFNIRYYNKANELPDWWIPGRDVYLHFDKTGTGTDYMGIRIIKYDANGNMTTSGDWYRSATIHIPEDFDGVGLALNFHIPTGRTVSGSAHAYILNTKSNQELATETRRVSELKVACFGDSVMWGRDGNGSRSTQTPYTIPKAIAKRLSCVCDNYGVRGQGFIHSDGTPNAYDNISGVNLTAYTVMVMCYGVDDGYDTVGEWDSTDESTTMGQFNKIVNYVYTQNPNIRLIVFAPWPGRNVGSFPDYWYGDVTVASTGRTSRKILSDAMKRACDYYWIPYIEQYDSPINPLNINIALPDGVHPSNEFYKILGDWVAAKVSGLL